MKKIILIAVGAVVLLGGGIGGTMAYLSLHHGAPAKAVAPPPKPIVFAELDNLVVNVPADSSNPASSFVQITLQFATTEPDAVTSFTSLQPIITAQVIALLMTKTAKSLMDPATHDALAQNCLGIANGVLNKSAGFKPPSPFTAAYITNIVEQN